MTRFAVVGVGAQAAALARIAPRLRGGSITAVVEPDKATAKRVAELLKVSVWATSTGELHEKHDREFDAWAAAMPLGLVLAPHGNRPFDMNPGNGKDWLWAHAFRFLPSVTTVKESLGSGKLGAPGLVRIHHWTPQAARQSLFSQLDLACWLIDQRPATLFARQAKGYVQVHLGFADDRMAVLDCATLAEGDEHYSLSVIGSSGAAYADDHHNMQLVFGGGHPQAIRTLQGDKALLAALQEFIDATAARRSPSCGFAELKRALRLDEHVEASLTSGEAVSLSGGES